MSATPKQEPSHNKDGRSRRPLWLLLGGAVLGLTLGVVIGALTFSSSDDGGDEVVEMQADPPPVDGDCGFPLSGPRSGTQVLVDGGVNCDTATAVLAGLEDAPLDNPELIGGGKTVTVDGTEWSCSPPTPSVECSSADGVVTESINPGG